MKRFIKTSIADDIEDIIDSARDMKCAAAIIGPPGIGKTVALENVKRKDRNAIYWRVSTPERTERAALRVFANHLGIGTGAESAAKLWNSIEGWMESHALYSEDKYLLNSGDKYLLIDEAQVLDLNLLKELVDLPSRYGFPVITCGNPDLLKRTRVERGPYDQIASRCSKRLILSKPLEKDYIDIAIDFDVLGADARAAVVAYGDRTTIRELVELLKKARGIAGTGPLRLEELRRAAGPKAMGQLKPAA